ncbi:MAG TPA: metallophosphoesterase family protein [Anaerolineaceae bacterium]
MNRLVGVISDTHGLLRPEAQVAMAGCEKILHAGDVGDPEILEELGAIAPTTAVRGNADRDPWAESLPGAAVVQVGDDLIVMVHDLDTLEFDPAALGCRVVISGHSHRASVTWKGKVLYLNPGSAGPRRFGQPVSVAHLIFSDGQVQAEIIPLDYEAEE